MHASDPISDPIRAVVHPDPYPYYASRLAGPALAFEPALGLWVASSASAVTEVLAHPACRVRPLAEPVPRLIAGSPAGEVFGHLVRMNEGATHERPKSALGRALAAVDRQVVARRTRAIAEALPADPRCAQALTQWCHALPVSVIADCMGFAATEQRLLTAWMADFVACLSPLATAEQLHDAALAAERLLERFETALREAAAAPASLVGQVRAAAETMGWTDARAIVANLIGLLSQTYEATAGLLGNTVVALLEAPAWQQALRERPADTARFVAEVARTDPSIHNTRRFVAEPCTVAGMPLEPGAGIVLLLAAANRDPQANPDPELFSLERPARKSFGFGGGRHACPGEALACAIVSTALAFLLQTGLPALQTMRWSYRPSVNARIPVFASLESLP